MWLDRLFTRLFIIWWLNTIPALCHLQYTFYSAGLALLHPKKQEGSVQYTNPQQPMKIWVVLFKDLPHIYICIHNNTHKSIVSRRSSDSTYIIVNVRLKMKEAWEGGYALSGMMHSPNEWRIGFTSRHGKVVLATWQNLLLDILYICYQLELGKYLVNVSTECSSRHWKW